MDGRSQRFPYMELGGVVAVSVIVTLGIFWVWHMVGMRSLAETQEREKITVRTNIATLDAYIGTLGATSSREK